MSIETFKPLKVESLLLHGQHLMEASAGTGKTFNITRIYLRLLLEKKLTVQEILVMTFTRDATEELRGRIRDEIQTALIQWGNFSESDEFYNHMQNTFSLAQVKPLLNNALLHMDEAAIFTIHGFCNRVLTEQAFASGLEFSMQMEANTQEIEIEAIRDLYRMLSTGNPSDFELLSSLWLTPELFYKAFRSVLSDDGLITSVDVESLLSEIVDDKQLCLQELERNQTSIYEAIIASHKDKSVREKEWAELLAWLNESKIRDMPKLAKDFLNGGRYRKAENKALVSSTLAFKAIYEHKMAQIHEGRVYQLAHKVILQARQSILHTKAHQQVMNFDDLITTLKTCLLGVEGEALAKVIRRQYPVALVDEFQDTDPQQFAILNAIYACASFDERFALFMIGDPKQAIYGFRGGDIFAYLQARSFADHAWVMDTNWRSTPEMITAYNRLFFGESLVDNVANDNVFGYGIDYLPVKASSKCHDRIVNDEHEQALQFVYFPVNDEFKPTKGKKEINTAPFRDVIANWCASEIQRLLTTEIAIGDESVKEDDIAILVRSGGEARQMQRALEDLGYNSVYLSNKENLFHSHQAAEFLVLMEGVVEFENSAKMIAALSTRYMGGTSELLSNLQHDERLWESSINTMKHLHDLWLSQGFMTMALKLIQETYTPEPEDHERAMTNTIHLIELLQQASVKHKQPRQLVHYLLSQIQLGNLQQEAELRLESDEKLIKIVTQHGCKGLEYPIVFIPFSSKYSDPTKIGQKKVDIHYYHDNQGQSIRQLGQAPEGVGLSKDESLAESVRLLYVSVTRAVQRCYVCATAFDDVHLSPLGRTLRVEETEQFERAIFQLSEEQPDTIGLRYIEDITFDSTATVQKEIVNDAIDSAFFTGEIEIQWKLNSFTSLTRNMKYHSALSLPDRSEDSAENYGVNQASESIEFAIKKGADTGHLLHDTLERLDFSTPNYAKASSLPLMRYSFFPEAFESEDFYAWLGTIISTPLTLKGQEEYFTLTDLSFNNTLKEVEFYFPIENVDMSSLVSVLAKHRGVNASVIQRALPSTTQLQGMMHGFIDLIAHWQDSYFVIDYKSTYLGSEKADYSEESMKQDIEKNFYDLQYLIYTLALHRFLKRKISDYDPQLHLGGVYYLYLRGMNKETKEGVYNTAIDLTLLDALDDVFNGQTLMAHVG